jgi:HD-GYP domain-containing protein (c-di-GMP phosphodiesterase class II)
MNSNLLDKTEAGDCPIDEQLGSQLEQLFGTAFSYWTHRSNKWRPMNEGFSASDSHVGKAMVAAAAVSQTAGVSVLDDGECLLAIPLDRCNERYVVATAKISDMPAEAIRRHADLFLDAASARLANARLTMINTSLTMQVTESFEELSFLHSMTTNLALDIHCVKLEEVVRMLLTRLCAILRAENIVLVLPPVAKAMLFDQQMLWASDVLLSDVRLVNRYEELGAKVMQSTVIENEFQTTDFAKGFPEVHGLIGVMVGEENDQGWLIAINRAVPTGIDPVEWSRSEHQFGTVEASLMSSTGSILSTHFHNVELLKQKETLFTEIVRALVNAVEAKDSYLCGHSERVALYSQCLARKLKWDDKSCDQLYLSGLLHDVGKIAISDSALQKPCELTTREFEEIRRHPDEAWNILHDLEHMRAILPAVLFHHERYDGEGYPDGLVGDSIPVEGRVMAICDVFDAMTSDRPYRNGIPVDKAASILRAGAGTQWDPMFISEFLAILPEINSIRENYTPRPHKTRQSEVE